MSWDDTLGNMAVLDQWLGLPVHTKALWRAWEPVLFNQTHDLASGVMTDRAARKAGVGGEVIAYVW